jgi:hypothetical protein
LESKINNAIVKLETQQSEILDKKLIDVTAKLENQMKVTKELENVLKNISLKLKK